MPDTTDWIQLKVRPFGERWARFLDQIPGQFEMIVERGNDERDAAAAVMAGSSVILGPQISVALAGIDRKPAGELNGFRERWCGIDEFLRGAYEAALEQGQSHEQAAESALKQASRERLEPDLIILVQRNP